MIDIVKDWSTTLKFESALTCTNRTAEVTEAIEKGTLNRFTDQSSSQRKEIVVLVRNGISAGLRNTLRSLLVLEIHAKGKFAYHCLFHYYWDQYCKKIVMKYGILLYKCPLTHFVNLNLARKIILCNRFLFSVYQCLWWLLIGKWYFSLPKT